MIMCLFVSYVFERSLFSARDTFLIIINVENGCDERYFCGNRDTFYF